MKHYLFIFCKLEPKQTNSSSEWSALTLFPSSAHPSDVSENWRERRTQTVDHRQRGGGGGWMDRGGRGTAAGRHFHQQNQSSDNFGGGRPPSTSWPSRHPVPRSRANRGRYHQAPRWRHFGSVFALFFVVFPLNVLTSLLHLSSQVVQTSCTRTRDITPPWWLRGCSAAAGGWNGHDERAEGIAFLWTNRLVSRSSGMFVEGKQSEDKEDSTQRVLDSQSFLYLLIVFTLQATKALQIVFIH